MNKSDITKWTYHRVLFLLALFHHDFTFERVIAKEASCEFFRFTVGIETFMDKDDDIESEALVSTDAFQNIVQCSLHTDTNLHHFFFCFVLTLPVTHIFPKLFKVILNIQCLMVLSYLPKLLFFPNVSEMSKTTHTW